jgi:hypothetical protein
MPQDHWLTGFNFNVEEWDAEGQHYETLAICRTLAFARAVFEVAVEEKSAGRFMIRSRTRVRPNATPIPRHGSTNTAELGATLGASSLTRRGGSRPFPNTTCEICDVALQLLERKAKRKYLLDLAGGKVGQFTMA